MLASNKNIAHVIITTILLLVVTPTIHANENAEHLFEQKKYTQAAEIFQDEYKKGVAYYRAENYQKAIESFKKVTRDKAELSNSTTQTKLMPLQHKTLISAQYNIGNSYFKLKQYQKAIENTT